MLRNSIPVVFVALLVVTAGCVGGGGSGASPENGGVADANDGGGGNADGGGSGDGGDATGIATNQTAILRAAGSYTSAWRMRVLEGNEQVSEMAYVTAIDYDAERYSFETRNTDHGRTRTNAAAYFADGRSFQRFGEGDEATYGSNTAEFDTVSMSATSRMGYVSRAGDLVGFSDAGTDTYDGVSVRRYVMDERPIWLAAQEQSDGEVRWTGFSYEVLVDDQGLVRSEVWRSTGVDDTGVQMAIEFSYELSDVGHTVVSAPDWLGEIEP